MVTYSKEYLAYLKQLEKEAKAKTASNPLNKDGEYVNDYAMMRAKYGSW